MGKKGKELRDQKASSVKYTFTMEQLRERDRQTIERCKQQLKEDFAREFGDRIAAEEKRLKDDVDKYLAEEWKKREELLRDTSSTSDLMSLLLCVSARVLIEKFKWKPIPKDGTYDNRNKIVRFSECVTEELNAMSEDDHKDIRNYCEETYELYGVKFKSE